MSPKCCIETVIAKWRSTRCSTFTRKMKRPRPVTYPYTLIENLFESKTFMKKVISDMIKKEKISKIGYDRQKKQFLGYKLNSEKAFEYTHPEVLLTLSPIPDVRILRRLQKEQAPMVE